MPYNLKELGIRSEHDAAELEEVLGIKFSDFTDFDLWHWQRQTLSLNQFALTRSYTFAAQSAGVTVYTMRVWEQNNFLGYAQRKEIADLAFCDWLNGLLIQRVQQPDAPPSLLAMLLRAHMPEKYRAARSGGASYPVPQDNDPVAPHDEAPAPEPDIPPPLPFAGEGRGEGEPPPAPEPDPNLSPSAPSAVNPLPSVRPEPVEGPNPDSQSTPAVIPANAGIHPSPSAEIPPQHPAPSTQNPPTLTRQQRRQLQRKQQKSNLARAPN